MCAHSRGLRRRQPRVQVQQATPVLASLDAALTMVQPMNHQPLIRAERVFPSMLDGVSKLQLPLMLLLELALQEALRQCAGHGAEVQPRLRQP